MLWGISWHQCWWHTMSAKLRSYKQFEFEKNFLIKQCLFKYWIIFKPFFNAPNCVLCTFWDLVFTLQCYLCSCISDSVQSLAIFLFHLICFSVGQGCSRVGCKEGYLHFYIELCWILFPQWPPWCNFSEALCHAKKLNCTQDVRSPWPKNVSLCIKSLHYPSLDAKLNHKIAAQLSFNCFSSFWIILHLIFVEQFSFESGMTTCCAWKASPLNHEKMTIKKLSWRE